MPYISQKQRAFVDDCLKELLAVNWNAGELNYIITQLIWGAFQWKPGYLRIMEVNGTLETVKAEFYRRVAAPYEDAKCAENGDVFQAKEEQ